MRTTPAQGDDCDKYGDRCDGQLDVTVNEDGSVEHDCSDCGRSGWSRRIEWREAWLPFSDRSATSDSSEATMPSGASSRDEDDQPNGLIWDREDCPEDDCDGELQQQDEFNVMCLSCEVIWSHIAFPTEHQLQTKTGQTVARKDRRVATDGGQSTDALARINGDDVILEIGCSPQWAAWAINAYKQTESDDVIETNVLLKETDGWGLITAARDTIVDQLDGGEPTRLLEDATYHYRLGFDRERARALVDDLETALAAGADGHQIELRLTHATLESLVRQFRRQIE